MTVRLGPEAAGPVVLTPPRPNLGPEPWRDEPASALWIWLALAAAACLTIATVRRRRRTAGVPAFAQAEFNESPEVRLVALSDGLRAVLAARLGPAIRARTTEEIAADPRLAGRLDAEDLGRLAVILGACDRVKFSGPGADEAYRDRLPEWAQWAGSLDARFAASSRGADVRRQSPSP